MITFNKQIIIGDFDVWDIYHDEMKIGWLRKDKKNYYLEVLYAETKLRLNQRKFIKPIIMLSVGLLDINTIKENLKSTKEIAWSELTKDVENAKGFEIKQ